MTNDVPSASTTDALRGFIRAPSDAEADRWLAVLFGAETDRILQQTIGRALGPRYRHTAAEDVVGDARLRLVARVRELRARGEEDAIADFAGYAATVGFNAAYVFLRMRFPARTRLKNKIRYVASRHPRIRLREDASGETVCEWAGPRLSAPGAERLFRDSPQKFADLHRVKPRGPLAALIADVVSRLDQAIALEALVDGVAILVGLEDDPPRAAGANPRDIETVADTARAFTSRLEDREYLEQVWRAIATLQPRQRAALLLNLREPAGGAALRLVPLIGLASIGEIASVIDIPAAALASLWSGLPLDDLQIGAHLGITRQQVINLRKTARATLARRLRKLE